MRMNLFRRPRRGRGNIWRRLMPGTLSSPLRRVIQLAVLAGMFWSLWLSGQQIIPGEKLGWHSSPLSTLLLQLDAFAAASAALASRSAGLWLLPAGVVLLAAFLAPRCFCGWICPLGTLSDIADVLLLRHVRRIWRGRRHSKLDSASDRPVGVWYNWPRYGLLAAMLALAAMGFGAAIMPAAIPLLVRGLGGVWQVASPTIDGAGIDQATIAAIVLLALVLAAGLLRPRFWCRYVCPTGALLSLASRFAWIHRRVGAGCVSCGRCAEVCSMGAISADGRKTSTSSCISCQACGGACPTEAVDFVTGGRPVSATAERSATSLSGDGDGVTRRGFIAIAAGGAAGAAIGQLNTAGLLCGHAGATDALVRPPGSIPENEFIGACLRCGNCLHVCPTGTLRAARLGEGGIISLWTPVADGERAGCAAECNRCGQTCPSAAIRPLSLEEKRVARMGLAAVDEKRCLPYANKQSCRYCVDACKQTGHEAIEVQLLPTEFDEDGMPVENSMVEAPVVLADKCVGCGICQARCRAMNVDGERLLEQSAIVVAGGAENSDRLASGSYIELRRRERQERDRQSPVEPAGGGYELDL